MPLIEVQKGGTDFLASSHFNLGPDSNIVMKNMRSTFMNDYPPWPINAKPNAADPPGAAGVLNEDHTRYKFFMSETKRAFDEKQLPEREAGTDPDKLRATNFKMDGDHRLKTFDTTQKMDFPPKQGDGGIWALQKGVNTQKSNFPQGDPSKADMPISDYRSRYTEHEVQPPEKPENKHLTGKPTIRGDDRQHNYRTTHSDVYHPLDLPGVKAFPAQRGSSLPQGDPEKERSFKTVFQDSYIEHDLSGQGQADPNATAKLQKTSIKEQENRLNNYMSTFQDAYRPTFHEVERAKPTRSRNDSTFPKGDEDPYRNAEQANVTTNRFYQQKMEPTTKPKIISGSDRRTKSNVEFGDPDQMKWFYETTTGSTFQPKSVPYTYGRANLNQSNIPTDYYKDEIHHTTYRTDFIPQEDGVLVVNEDALDRLKESHLHPPWKAERFFSTEHKDQFYQKRGDKSDGVDPWRLQKSSVPLGTMYKQA